MDERNKKIIIGLLSVFTIMLVLNTIQIFALSQNLKHQKNGEGISIEEKQNVTIDEKKSIMIIKNPYCEVHIPDKYYKYLDVKEVENSNGYRQEFFFQYDDVNQRLFTLSFGEFDSEINLGYIEKNNSKIKVGISVEKIDTGEEWNEIEYMTITKVQECVNDVISSITQADFFEKE